MDDIKFATVIFFTNFTTEMCLNNNNNNINNNYINIIIGYFIEQLFPQFRSVYTAPSEGEI